MAFSFLSFSVAKKQLEKEMDDLQQRWTYILPDQSEGSAIKKQTLEYEIEDRGKAIEKLDTKTCCDRCESPVETPQLLRFRITHSSSMITALDVRKVLLWAECEECCRIATPDQIRSANLTIKQERDLECYASRLVKQVEGACKCRIWGTSEDLRNEAYIQTLEGRKKWFMAHVDWFGHLLRATENIAWDWGKKAHREIPEADSVKYDAKTGEEFSPFDIEKSSEALLPDRRLIKRQELERFKTALIIEPDPSVLRLMKHLLNKDGFKVIDTLNAEEGLLEYSESSKYIRFDLVVVSHLPYGVKLAMNILRKNPSQKVIITTTDASEENVVRPNDLIDVPILLKPFRKTEFMAVLKKMQQNPEETATKKLASHCRQKRRMGTRARTTFANRKHVKSSKAKKRALLSTPSFVYLVDGDPDRRVSMEE